VVNRLEVIKQIWHLGFLVFVCSSASGLVIQIPGDYPTIQAGIDASINGDTVLVADGTYMGAGNRDINFEGKAIVVLSENGPQSCAIDCAHSGRGFQFDSMEPPEPVVCGFTIQNGKTEEYAHGGAIYCSHSSPTIIDCHILNNTSFNGGGFRCVLSEPSLNNCVFSTHTLGENTRQPIPPPVFTEILKAMVQLITFNTEPSHQIPPP